MAVAIGRGLLGSDQLSGWPDMGNRKMRYPRMEPRVAISWGAREWSNVRSWVKGTIVLAAPWHP